MEKGAFFQVFHQDVDAIIVAEETEHTDYVWMVEEEGYFELLHKLVDYWTNGFLSHLLDG